MFSFNPFVFLTLVRPLAIFQFIIRYFQFNILASLLECLHTAVLNVVSGIEGVDMQLMPASFKSLQSDFRWALQDLGSLVFYQASSWRTLDLEP